MSRAILFAALFACSAAGCSDAPPAPARARPDTPEQQSTTPEQQSAPASHVSGDTEERAAAGEERSSPDEAVDAGAPAADAAQTRDAAPAPAPALPTVGVRRQGALGFCIAPGMVLSATIAPDERGRTVFSGDFPQPCTGSNCPRSTPFAARALSASEVARLQALIAQLPEQECPLELGPLCDPCLLEKLTIGDKVYSVNPCDREGCDGHRGAVSRLLTFIDNLAATDPQRDAEDCYSPTQNLERASQPGATGCACAWHGQGICVMGAAFACEGSPSGDVSRWQAVIDGPCWHGGSCSRERPGEVLDLEGCLGKHVLCVGPAEGRFCPVD